MFTDPWTLDGSLNAYGSLGIHVAGDGTVDDAWQGIREYHFSRAGGERGIRSVRRTTEWSGGRLM